MIQSLIAVVAVLLVQSSAPPVTRVWDGGGGTFSWHTAANWDPDGVPQAGDNVIIDVPGVITVNFTGGTSSIQSLTCADNLTISGGTLNINGSSLITGTLTMSNSLPTLQGTGDIVIDGQFVWLAGTLDGAGTTTIGLTGSLSMPPSGSPKSLRRVLENDGDVTLASSFVYFSNGTLINRGAVTFAPPSSDLYNIYGQGGANEFVNNGLCVKTGPGVFQFLPNQSGDVIHFINHNTVQIDQSFLRLSTSTSTGEYLLPGGPGSGLTLLSGNHLLTETSIVQGTGQVTLGGDTSPPGNVIVDGAISTTGSVFCRQFVTINGRITIGDVFNAAQGQVVLNSAPQFLANSSFNFNSVVLQFNAGPVVLPGGTATYAELEGPTDVIVTGSASWASGEMRGQGRTVVAEGASFSPLADFRLKRPLENNGTLTLQTYDFEFHEAGTIINHANLQLGEGYLEAFGGSNGAIINVGQITKSSGGAFTLSGLGGGVFLENLGTITIGAGELDLAGGALLDGTITVNAPGVVRVRSGVSYGEGSAIMGTGLVNFVEGDHDIIGEYLCTGTLLVDDAAVRITNSFTPTGPVRVVQGTLIVDASQVWPVLEMGRFTLRQPVLGGTGDITLTGNCHFAGDMVGSGKTIIARGASLLIDDDYSPLPIVARVLENHGSLHLSTSTLSLAAGAIENHGQMFCGGATLRGIAGDNELLNVGVISKGGFGTVSVEADPAPLPFNNHGALNIDGGTFVIQSGGAGEGTITIAPGATLKVVGSYAVGQLTVNGTFSLSGDSELDLFTGYTQSPTGSLQLVVGEKPTTAIIDSVGDVNLAGIIVASIAPPPTSLTKIKIIAASGGQISGAFNTESLNPNGMISYGGQTATWIVAGPGDVNFDDVVNVLDLLAVILAWGPCPSPCAEDVSPPGGDGVVNINDLLVVISNWTGA